MRCFFCGKEESDYQRITDLLWCSLVCEVEYFKMNAEIRRRGRMALFLPVVSYVGNA